MLLDPLKYFYNNYPFDYRKIKSLVIGEKYVAVLLKNGNIGVCACLNHKVEINIEEQIDINNLSHRIVYNAYLNSWLNYNVAYDEKLDIFQSIDFKNFKKIVMVGFFRPLYSKFIESNIEVFVFDKVENDTILKRMDEIESYLSTADAIILTSTSISNNSFYEIVSKTGENSKIFLLGPSTILSPYFLEIDKIIGLYGTVFLPNDTGVLEIIEKGGGSREFLKFGQKVSFLGN